MTFPKARLIVSLCLFLAWLGFLGFLVSERYTIILSQPQFALAEAYVIVTIKADDATAAVKEVAWCAHPADRELLTKKPLVLPELVSLGKAQGFMGPGDYILPLVRSSNYFEIAPVRTGGARHLDHAALYVSDGGQNIDAVLKRLLRYAEEKPQHAVGLVEPAIARYAATRMLLPHFDVALGFHDLELPRRLPLADAKKLQQDLIALGAKVQLYRGAELRIYPDLAQTRSQLAKIIVAKK
jgi:hypothetical protein